MKGGDACAQGPRERIEWTGAGGDYFLGIVVDDTGHVISEFWGTHDEMLAWMKTSWPQLPAHYVPMVYSGNVTPRGKLRPAPKKYRASSGGR